MLADQVERRFGQRVAELLGGVEAGRGVDPVDV